VLRIFELKEDEILSLRKMHNEKVYNLLLLPDVITMIKTRRMERGGHVA
jgi:hypothetical protein